MPAVIPILASLGTILSRISWITVIAGIIGSALFLGIVPFFLKQQTCDVQATVKRVTNPIVAVSIVGFAATIYLILKEIKRK